MRVLVVTEAPDAIQGEALLRAIGRCLNLKRVRSEHYVCTAADHTVERLVGRIRGAQILIDQTLPINGVPHDYKAHVAVREKAPQEQHAVLQQAEAILRSSGYSCQLLELDRPEPTVMPSDLTSTETKVPMPVVAWVYVASGLYIVAGFFYVLLQSNWPPFWPPMHATISILNAFPDAAFLIAAVVLGTIAVASGPTLLLVGFKKLWAWHRHPSRGQDGA
ncbi:hypothetical protein ACVNIS_06570 [Sphaerotilaceae bacterium SBD11-9]